MKKWNARMMVTLGVLIAVEIVLSRFLSINTWSFKIGFSFVPIVLAAMLYGPVGGGVTAALGDFLGAVLFPIGPYFPGFTLTALLHGVVFGLFLYRKRTLPRIIGAVAINQLVLSLFLNSLWISMLYGSPYQALLVSRSAQCVFLLAVQVAVTGALDPLLSRCGRKVLA